MLAGDAAGGVYRGGRFFVAPPLYRLLWYLSCPVQERNSICQTNSGLAISIRRVGNNDQSGEPNGVAITAAPKARIARGGIPAKFRFGKQLSLRYEQR